MKVKEGFDVYDELPEDMIAYLRYNGRHFNRRLVEYADMCRKGVQVDWYECR